MKITATYLRQVIKEELEKFLLEQEEGNTPTMSGAEATKRIVEKIPHLKFVLSQAGYYDDKILRKLANDVEFPAKLKDKLEEIRELRKVFMEIDDIGFTYDEEGREGIINNFYEGWDEDDFAKYIKLLRMAIGA